MFSADVPDRTAAILSLYGFMAVLQVMYMKYEAAGHFPAVEEDGSCEQAVETGKWIIAYDHEKEQLNTVVSSGGYGQHRNMF